MRILITGSSGQIGTNLALRCLAAGHQVLGVDIRRNGWTQAFPSELQDLSAPTAHAALAKAQRAHGRPDVVVHLAAHAKVHLLVQRPALAMENIAMTQQVLEYCREAALPVVFASSREVYGNVQRGSTCESDAVPLHAASPYAASKIAGEALVQSYGRCYGLPWLVFRLSNVYGRYDNDLERMERVIPLFARKLLAGEPLTVFGADKVLDFTHVDDCVAGLFAGIEALHRRGLRDETFNLARGQGHTLVQMARWLAQALEREPEIRLAPAQAGEMTHYVANIDKARALLGYAPAVALREGLRLGAKSGACSSTTLPTPPSPPPVAEPSR
jgi:nucleoside-diphosphate-sugar epimerase